MKIKKKSATLCNDQSFYVIRIYGFLRNFGRLVHFQQYRIILLSSNLESEIAVGHIRFNYNVIFCLFG